MKNQKCNFDLSHFSFLWFELSTSERISISSTFHQLPASGFEEKPPIHLQSDSCYTTAFEETPLMSCLIHALSWASATGECERTSVGWKGFMMTCCEIIVWKDVRNHQRPRMNKPNDESSWLKKLMHHQCSTLSWTRIWMTIAWKIAWSKNKKKENPFSHCGLACESSAVKFHNLCRAGIVEFTGFSSITSARNRKVFLYFIKWNFTPKSEKKSAVSRIGLCLLCSCV